MQYIKNAVEKFNCIWGNAFDFEKDTKKSNYNNNQTHKNLQIGSAMRHDSAVMLLGNNKAKQK